MGGGLSTRLLVPKLLFAEVFSPGWLRESITAGNRFFPGGLWQMKVKKAKPGLYLLACISVTPWIGVLLLSVFCWLLARPVLRLMN